MKQLGGEVYLEAKESRKMSKAETKGKTIDSKKNLEERKWKQAIVYETQTKCTYNCYHNLILKRIS